MWIWMKPFWPTGSGCARGWLSSFDACWAINSWSNGKTPLEVLAERESIYRLLAQTTPENLSKDHSGYTVEPQTRYPNLNMRVCLDFQVSFDISHLSPISYHRLSSIVDHLIIAYILFCVNEIRDFFVLDFFLFWSWFFKNIELR